MKILIADDHALFRDGLKKILLEKFNDLEIEEAANYGELFSKIKDSKWDVIILDLNMPGRSGFEALIELKSQMKDLNILILSMYPESEFATRAIRAGAKGYLTKGSSVDELIEAISAILKGEVYFTKEVAQVVAKDLQSNASSKINLLSDREYEIFLMLVDGESISGIARKFTAVQNKFTLK